MLGEETRRDETRRDGKGKKGKGKRKKENFSIGKEGNSDGDGNRVMVIMKKRLKKWTYRTRKDDVERGKMM